MDRFIAKYEKQEVYRFENGDKFITTELSKKEDNRNFTKFNGWMYFRK